MIQLIYRIIYWPPVNKVLLLVNKLLKNFTSLRLHPSGTYRIKIDKATSFKMSANQTSYVHKLLYWNGPLQFEYTPIFVELIKHCKVFIDVGANTGYYSLLASTVNKDIIVHAFEPAIGPGHFLQKNIRINSNARIINHSIALSSNTGKIKFFNVRNHKYTYLKFNLSGTSSLIEDKNKKSYEVNTTTLDDFVQSNLKELSFIKIDTEGTENIILNGALNTLRKYHPIIICEVLYNSIEKELDYIFLKEGYVFFGHLNGRLYKVNSLVRKMDDGIRDCLFVHSSKENFFKEILSKYLAEE